MGQVVEVGGEHFLEESCSEGSASFGAENTLALAGVFFIGVSREPGEVQLVVPI